MTAPQTSAELTLLLHRKKAEAYAAKIGRPGDELVIATWLAGYDAAEEGALALVTRATDDLRAAFAYWSGQEIVRRPSLAKPPRKE